MHAEGIDNVTYYSIVDCNVSLAEMYGDVALSAIAIGDDESAYYFAMLAAHKAGFTLPDSDDAA